VFQGIQKFFAHLHFSHYVPVGLSARNTTY
jgi:hypothetical protein